jgi:hypothetical protein
MKTGNPTFILLLLIAGILISVSPADAEQASAQNAELVIAKSSVADHSNHSKEGQKTLSEFFYPLPTTQFEPLLLLLLGTVLLSIVTGINLLRSRKLGFPLHSPPQREVPGQAAFGARKSPAEKNEAA